MSAPVREDAKPECDDAVTPIVALPTPLARSRVSHGTSTPMLHVASAGETTMSTKAVPPADGIVSDAGPAVIDGVAPACVTVSTCPATLIAAVRGTTDAVWAATETVSDALPLPAAGVTTSHGCELVADQGASGSELPSETVRIDSPAPTRDVSLNWLNLFYAAEWVIFSGFAVYLWYRLVKDVWEHEREAKRQEAAAEAS